MKNRKGFTIVELVIVIAVIAILAAVLIPTFSSVTASAKASAAQQQAKAGLDSILALTGGVLPSGTTFCITEGKTAADIDLNYTFAYEKNKLEQKKVDEAAIPVKDNTYTVYVTASCWSTNTTDAAASTERVIALLLKALQKSNDKITGVSFGDSQGDYYAGTVTVSEGTAPTLKVYYTTDIQETMIVFIG